MKRTAVVATGVLVVGGAALAQARDTRITADEGGLSVSPFGVERTAAVGAKDAITIANRSQETLTVAVKARPWTQSSSGAVSPNRRATLGPVKVSAGDFSLAPGESRTLDVTLAATASGGSLYGALEVVGLPKDVESRKGVVTGYRLVGSLRYHPSSKTYKLKVGTPKVSKKQLVLPVRSQGNTNEPVSGTVRVKGALGTRNGSVKATRILPGKQVKLAVAKNLRAGSYTATISLKQGTLKTTVTKKLRIK